MSRRTLRAALSAAAFLGVAGLAAAKPPDLPLDHKDTVTPWVAPEGPEPPPGGCVLYAPPGSCPCHPAPDAVRMRFTAWLETLPPSVRRRVATSLLAGVHPLFWLIHPDKMLDFPCDHPAPTAAEEAEDADGLLAATRGQTTGSVLFGVGAGAAAGPKGQKSVRRIPAALTGELPFGTPPAEGEDSPCQTHTLTGILTEEEHPAYELQPEGPDEAATAPCRTVPEARAYPVGHLLPKDGPAEGDVAFLVGLISAATGRDAWASAGGVGTIEYFPAGRTLVVRQTPDVHRQVGQLLAGLGEYVGRKADHAAAPGCCTRPGAQALSAARPVRELLSGANPAADARPPARLKLVVEEDELPADADAAAGEQEEVAVPKAAAEPVRLTPPGCCAEADTSARGLRFLCRFPVCGSAVQIRYDGGGFTFAVTPAAPERAPAGGCEEPR